MGDAPSHQAMPTPWAMPSALLLVLLGPCHPQCHCPPLPVPSAPPSRSQLRRSPSRRRCRRRARWCPRRHLLGFCLGSQLALFHPPAWYVPKPSARIYLVGGGGEEKKKKTTQKSHNKTNPAPVSRARRLSPSSALPHLRAQAKVTFPREAASHKVPAERLPRSPRRRPPARTC